jgi:hypothetical protein
MTSLVDKSVPRAGIVAIAPSGSTSKIDQAAWKRTSTFSWSNNGRSFSIGLRARSSAPSAPSAPLISTRSEVLSAGLNWRDHRLPRRVARRTYASIKSSTLIES